MRFLLWRILEGTSATALILLLRHEEEKGTPFAEKIWTYFLSTLIRSVFCGGIRNVML